MRKCRKFKSVKHRSVGKIYTGPKAQMPTSIYGIVEEDFGPRFIYVRDAKTCAHKTTRRKRGICKVWVKVYITQKWSEFVTASSPAAGDRCLKTLDAIGFCGHDIAVAETDHPPGHADRCEGEGNEAGERQATLFAHFWARCWACLTLPVSERRSGRREFRGDRHFDDISSKEPSAWRHRQRVA